MNQRLTAVCLTIAAFANAIRLFYQNCVFVLQESYDTGWIVRVGEYICKFGPPRHDVFSWTHPQQGFIAYQWLFELFCYLLFKVGGLWTVGLAACCMTGVLYFAVLPLIWLELGLPLVVPLMSLALVLNQHWFNLRPQLFSYFILLLFVHLLEKNRRGGSRLVWLLPLLTAAWSNLHTFWSFGLGIVLVYFICAAVRREGAAKLLSVFLACVGAVFLNPYGFGLFGYVFGFLNGAQFLGMSEALPTYTDPSAVFTMIYLVMGWVALIRSRKSMSPESIAVCLLITVAGLAVRRYQSLAVIVTWTYFGQALASAVDWKKFSFTTAAKSGILEQVRQLLFSSGKRLKPLYLCFIALALSTACWAARHPDRNEAEKVFCSDTSEVIQLISSHTTSRDRIFNDPTTGSWMIFFGSTNVFIDTRYDMYPKSHSERTVSCIRAEPGWDDYFKQQGINRIAVRNDWPLLISALCKSPDWKVVADDGFMSFWIRTQANGPDLLAQWHLSDRELSQAKLSQGLIKETIQSRCRQYFYRAKHNSSKSKHVEAVKDLERAVALLPESAILSNALNQAKAKSGKQLTVHRLVNFKLPN